MGILLVYYLMDTAYLLKVLGIKILGSMMLMSLSPKSGQHQYFLPTTINMELQQKVIRIYNMITRTKCIDISSEYFSQLIL